MEESYSHLITIDGTTKQIELDGINNYELKKYYESLYIMGLNSRNFSSLSSLKEDKQEELFRIISYNDKYILFSNHNMSVCKVIKENDFIEINVKCKYKYLIIYDKRTLKVLLNSFYGMPCKNSLSYFKGLYNPSK